MRRGVTGGTCRSRGVAARPAAAGARSRELEARLPWEGRTAPKSGFAAVPERRAVNGARAAGACAGPGAGRTRCCARAVWRCPSGRERWKSCPPVTQRGVPCCHRCEACPRPNLPMPAGTCSSGERQGLMQALAKEEAGPAPLTALPALPVPRRPSLALHGPFRDFVVWSNQCVKKAHNGDVTISVFLRVVDSGAKSSR